MKTMNKNGRIIKSFNFQTTGKIFSRKRIKKSFSNNVSSGFVIKFKKNINQYNLI